MRLVRVKTKQRSSTHVAADKGIQLVKQALPPGWVAREASPDYGIDLFVETFTPDNDSSEDFYTLGEHIFIQVKAVNKTEVIRRKVSSRGNVLLPGSSHLKDQKHIKVVSFSLDTALLSTVETMGAVYPVLLCLADISESQVYFVCLNDYISKILIPEKPNYAEQKTVTIHVPVSNKLGVGELNNNYLWLLAKRGKLYGLFNALAYQAYHLDNLFASELNHPSSERAFYDAAKTFLSAAQFHVNSSLRTAVWHEPMLHGWSLLNHVYSEFKKLEIDLHRSLSTGVEQSEYESLIILIHKVHAVFKSTAAIGRTYEENVREWKLPTFLSTLIS